LQFSASIPRSCSSDRPARIAVRDLLGGDAPVQVEKVDRAPGRGVEEHVLPAGHRGGEVGEIGDPGVGNDQRGIGARLDESSEPVGDRR
jgi:hypothetical protein